MKNLTRIIIGTILIACGVIYILGAFGIADVKFSLDGWWTLFIIIQCLLSRDFSLRAQYDISDKSSRNILRQVLLLFSL